MGGAAGATFGAEGCGGRNAGGQPQPDRDRRPDRVLCQYAGVASGCWGGAECEGDAGPGEGAGVGGAAASGYSVRVCSGDDAAGAQSGLQSAVPGYVRMAEHPGKLSCAAGAKGAMAGLGGQGSDGEV